MNSTSSGKKSTIYDIARATGSSTSTVSMVLNGNWARYRIKEDTARRILECARALGYHVNQSARGLRLSRSGLAGMIIPHYRNRFFAGLAETFEERAKGRALCPIVVGTKRDPEVELNVTRTLLSQRVELLFIAGVRDPGPLNALCADAGVPSVNLDLPGEGAPSVVSDNRQGASTLAGMLLDKMLARGAAPEELILLGGIAHEYATEMRIAGFRDAFAARGLPAPAEDAIECCGYGPAATREALARRVARLGRLPAGMLMNSITAFEGLVQYAADLPLAEWQRAVVGCFDWDPFAVHLPFDVTMLRQDVQTMMSEAFALVDRAAAEGIAGGPHPRIVVPTRFGERFDTNDAEPRVDPDLS
ncbi:LacI family DNA-binding transcriptional regulator [Burkholderia gladioli]|uniref:LacI family DNA-binding transcriptional regulator n=2 Tax=Burkholderia gladioli TaxID=28095 RepID=UPI000BBD2E9F|nr:LacI family DNA-binding transcriptional regulator [Burkholderia gladioli]ATF88346.1 LacI family transcriptional regulator [Burkholderia gladioli pv. gladioli]KAF1058055.1 Catabolite control protein A [Burkholderia gladioli]MBA1365286.1 LacI family DNA-binding transcriptional regulator [Burkholderia gladioli]MBJ9661740.1 LacI family DNA-binding transcriptional regulator [Burkholderia gladioli]MBJ9711717.1 LacI family DNA-binding transcriptional regulator [Burkholderia gladioli]